jgi:hypothetical protein
MFPGGVLALPGELGGISYTRSVVDDFTTSAVTSITRGCGGGCGFAGMSAGGIESVIAGPQCHRLAIGRDKSIAARPLRAFVAAIQALGRGLRVRSAVPIMR